jgi:DNA repair exonuclease SbcCD nuclease subunit
MVKFVHSADWQLGMTRHFLSGEAQSRYSEARLEAIQSIGRLAAEQQCEFVVVAGDVFETNQVGRGVVLPALEAMAACRVPVLLLPGNHDAVNAGSVYRTRAFVDNKPANVTLLEPGETVTLGEVAVVPAAWETRAPDENPVEAAVRELPAGDGLRLLVAHGIVDEMSPQSAQGSVIRLATLEGAVRDGRAHYVALGDRHSVSEVGTTGRIWYSGTPLVTSYRESRPNCALVVELSAERVTVHEHEVGEWRFVEQRFDVGDDADVDAVEGWLAGLPDRRRSVVSLSFLGTVSLATKARLDDVLDRHREVLAALEVHDRHTDLAVLPDDGDFDALGLTGFAAAALDELVERGDAAQDALGLLYRLARSEQ